MQFSNPTTPARPREPEMSETDEKRRERDAAALKFETQARLVAAFADRLDAEPDDPVWTKLLIEAARDLRDLRNVHDRALTAECEASRWEAS